MEETKETAIWTADKGTKRYPLRMGGLSKMPKKLYIKGSLPEEDVPTVAIVGARACSSYGKMQALRFARYFSENGIQVLSGLARGVDKEAHRGALLGPTPTFAILGSGADVCYPKEHRLLYDDIIRQGGVISEYPPGTPPRAIHFPPRNRIISALSDVILVIEATKRSGALITVDFALEQGRPIYALPGPVDSPLSQGCHQLISEGAEIAFSPEIVLKEWDLDTYKGSWKDEKRKMGLARNEDLVYSCLDLQPKNLNFLSAKLKLAPEEILFSLSELQMQGLILEIGKNYYIKNI